MQSSNLTKREGAKRARGKKTQPPSNAFTEAPLPSKEHHVKENRPWKNAGNPKKNRKGRPGRSHVKALKGTGKRNKDCSLQYPETKGDDQEGKEKVGSVNSASIVPEEERIVREAPKPEQETVKEGSGGGSRSLC